MEITTKCNMDCFYCPIEDMSHEHMHFSVAKKIVDKYDSPKLFMLNGTGEPTLYPYLKELVEYIVDRGHCVTFITNGVRCVDEDVLRMLDHIIFSVDDSNTEKKVKTIEVSEKAIRHACKVIGYKKVFTMTAYYGQDLTKIKELSEELGFKMKKQRLQPKASYHKKYSIPGSKPKKLLCPYVEYNYMDFYFQSGKKAPCCFMVYEDVSMSAGEVKSSLKKGIVPECCSGCYLMK
jgi:MoaA/NifB/PqqE/SkfB family radical SAM enzyme